MTKADKEGQRKTPILRFKGFTDDWEQRKLGEIGKIRSCKRIYRNQTSSKGEIPFYKIGTFGKEADSFISRKLYEEYKERFSFPQVGDILISASGTLGRTVVYNGENAYFQDSNIVWIDNDNHLALNKYLEIYYQRIHWKASEGSTIKRLYNSDIEGTIISIPKRDEQAKLSKCLKLLNKVITLYDRKLKLLSQIKKYFLDNLFAKKEYPNLRFKGFTDAWEQRKLSSILIERKDLSTESKQFPLSSFIQEKGVVPKSQRYDRSFLVKDSSKKYKVTKFGDFIYSSNNLDTGSIGLNSYGNAVISPVYSVFSSKNSNILETNFVNLLFQQNFYKNKMLRFRQGVMYGQLKIKEDDFLKVKVNVPSQIEIKNIINLFSKIESYATLLENKKKQLVQIKNTLLNTMFI